MRGLTRKYGKTLLLWLILFLLFTGGETARGKVQQYGYQVLNTYPHPRPRQSFTQGLSYYKGHLYESTGLKGKSSLRRLDLESGTIEKIIYLPHHYFGEGITILQDKIYQLTWKANTGFIYNMDFQKINKFHYPHQGWGITNDGKYLIISDGTDQLYFLNPETLNKEYSVRVTMAGKALDQINELEYIKGEIWANIWHKNYIVIINPDSGKVRAKVNLEGIIDQKDYDYELNVLNGTAYDKKNDRLFITGKLWPLIFEIKLKGGDK